MTTSSTSCSGIFSLTDRFGLRLHREQKELPAYALTVAKGGLKLHEAGPKNASRLLESTNEGSARFTEDKTGAMAERVTMSDIATKIAQMLDRPVIDKTGSKARYDLRIDLTPFMPADPGEKPDFTSGLFTGFQEQPGLGFDAERDAIDLLVIDAMNKTATDN